MQDVTGTEIAKSEAGWLIDDDEESKFDDGDEPQEFAPIKQKALKEKQMRSKTQNFMPVPETEGD